MQFQYHAELVERYPNAVAGVILAQGIQNSPSADALKSQYIDEQQATIARIGETPLSQIESLAAWREAFRGFGIDPTKYRSAAESLLRRLTKKGDIPSINTLVDIGNLVSIRYALPVAVFDVRALDGPLTVRFATGEEAFTPLGVDEPEHPEAGEVIFADAGGDVYARRWCWRQSAASAAREDTTTAIIVTEGHHPDAEADVQRAVDALRNLLSQHVGGTFSSGIVHQTATVFPE